MSNSDAKLYMPCVCETGWDCQLGSGTLASARGWGRPARPSSRSRDLFAIGGVSREIAMPYRVSETAQQVGVEGVIATDSGGDGLDGGHPTRLPRSRVPYRVDPRARAPQCVSAQLQSFVCNSTSGTWRCRAKSAESEKSSVGRLFPMRKESAILQFCVFFRDSIESRQTFQRFAPVTESARESVATRESVKFFPTST